jgi:hypothetical protein
MPRSDLEGIASSGHDLERSPKCGLSRKGIHADIENLPIALAPCPTIGTTPLPRGTNHTRSQTDLYFRQLSACVLLPQYGMIATRSIERRWRSGGLQPPAEWSGRNVSLTFGRSPLPARAPRAIRTTNLLERGQSPRIHLHRQRLQLLAPAADVQPGAERHRAIGDLRRGVVHHALLAMQYFVHC